MNAVALAVIRLVLAAVCVAHGAHTLFGAWADPGVGPGGLQHTASYLAALGAQPAFPLAVASGLAQLGGGVLIGLGWFTRWIAIGGLAYVGVDIWKTHLKWGFFLNYTNDPARGHGVEYLVLVAGVLTCLAIAGPGDVSIDGQRTRSKASRAAGRARLRNKL